jgi:hypothetical protein
MKTKTARALFFAIIIAASSTSAEATMVNAEAIFDWTGFTFTTTGTLSATMIVQASQGATTTTMTKGSAIAAASAVNGFLTTSAGAVASPRFANVGRANVFASSVFWFYGTGAGSLVVTVPYNLELNSVETSDRDITSASASVFLFTGPGVGGSSDASDALSLTGAGAMSHDGTLTATSRRLFNPRSLY